MGLWSWLRRALKRFLGRTEEVGCEGGYFRGGFEMKDLKNMSYEEKLLKLIEEAAQ